jgi:hypothetical protein
MIASNDRSPAGRWDVGALRAAGAAGPPAEQIK